MEENINNKKYKTKYLLKLSFCFVLLLIVFLLPNLSFAVEGEAEETQEFIYLSDYSPMTGKDKSGIDNTKVGYGSLHLNRTDSGAQFSIRIEDGVYSFQKGIWAHAGSIVTYDLTNYQQYDYFTTYMGVNTSSGNNGNGVTFKIFTSKDGANWELKTDANPPTIKSGNNAIPVKIPIKGEKYLRLVANDNGKNGNDHSVYVEPKLIKKTYVEPGKDLVPSITDLDTKIKEFASSNADLSTNSEYKLTLLKRELISRVGEYGLRRFLLASDINKATFEWLTGDVKVLEYFILGGEPEGGYYNTLTQLTRLYEAHKDDFEITETTKYGTVLGDLYTRMALAMSLTHSQTFGLWLQSGGENKSDAVKRYEIYKDMHKNGNFVVLKNADGTPQLNEDGTPKLDITQWFENYTIEEMRYIFNNLSDDEETLWLNEYTQSFVDQYPSQYSRYLSPHPYMDYRWENLGQPEFYDPDKKDEWDAHFKGLFSKYNVTYREGLKKIWMLLRNPIVTTGAVCGGISKVGSSVRTSHGIPCVVIGQPGHAAMIYYWQNADGKGYWNLDNDVSGWTLSEKGERLLLGWGNASSNYARGSHQVVYMLLAQEALNDYENLVKCEELVYLAKVYTGDLAKQEEIYKEALEIQPINLDAWLGLMNVYFANENKTEDDFYDLAEELAENLKCFPLPMYHLTNLIKPKLTSVENSYKFTLLQTRILTEASVTPNNTADNYYVYQPSLTRLEANFLLGKIDKTIATFSFDGADAGKIVLSSRFDENGVRWDYSLDGKQTWTEVSFTAEEEHKLQLSAEQIASITAENDIYVHIVGVNYEEKNLYKIDILDNVITDSMYYGNDLENRVIGVNLTCEWRNSEDDPWTSYATSSPDNTGNKTLQVRQAATGVKLSSNVLTFTFTEDNQPDTRKYIPVSHLSIHAVSTQATANGGAAINAIDANYNTRWHSAWNGRDTERYIVIKLDQSVVLSAVEFVPAGGGNGRIVDGTVYGSMDGETWEELSKLTNQTYSTQANTNEQAKAFTKNFEIADENRKEVQYVKIVADRTNGNWFAARAFNLYQDLTKNPHPTAGVAYSTTKPTNGVVVARLINPSTEITITNNGGSDTYVFTENGNFTFEFVDANGNTGSAMAKVDWIDKSEPTVDVNYGLDADKKLTILLDNISEDVYLLDKDNNKINYIEVNTNKKVTNISYLDNSGNIYKVLDKDENGNTTKITYKNTIKNTIENPTDNIIKVETYVTTLTDGVVTGEEYFDNEGNVVTGLTDAEKELLRTLQQTARSNPLEQALETSGEYEFKLVDKSGNMLYKTIRVDYIDNSDTIIASDITYNITNLTNTDVVATINPYIIDTNGKHVSVEMVNNDKNKTYTFIENGNFTFEYKDSSDTENMDVKEHTAKVDWIDKVIPTAEVRYSTTESTDKAVVATLVNESEEITITNNGTRREYTFIENGEFVFKFVDKAGNEGLVTAKVDWILEDTTVISDKYKISANYISRIPIGTTVADFKANVTSNEELIIKDKNGNVLQETDILTTGVILNAGEAKQYNLVLIGDINGDGKLSITDLVKLKLFSVNILTPNTIEKIAGDMNGDGKLSITDLVQLKLKLVGIKK